MAPRFMTLSVPAYKYEEFVNFIESKGGSIQFSSLHDNNSPVKSCVSRAHYHVAVLTKHLQRKEDLPDSLYSCINQITRKTNSRNADGIYNFLRYALNYKVVTISDELKEYEEDAYADLIDNEFANKSSMERRKNMNYKYAVFEFEKTISEVYSELPDHLKTTTVMINKLNDMYPEQFSNWRAAKIEGWEKRLNAIIETYDKVNSANLLARFQNGELDFWSAHKIHDDFVLSEMFKHLHACYRLTYEDTCMINKLFKDRDYKKACLLFEGIANSGKTQIARALFNKFKPGNISSSQTNDDRFKFQDLKGKVCGLWDEALIHDKIVDTCKNITGGPGATFEVKSSAQCTINYYLPIIMTANNIPWRNLSAIDQDAFDKRVYYIPLNGQLEYLNGKPVSDEDIINYLYVIHKSGNNKRKNSETDESDAKKLKL